MAKKYVVWQFSPGNKGHKQINPLINLSQLGINASHKLIKTSLSLGASETADNGMEDQYLPYGDTLYGTKFNKYRDLTNQ